MRSVAPKKFLDARFRPRARARQASPAPVEGRRWLEGVRGNFFFSLAARDRLKRARDSADPSAAAREHPAQARSAGAERRGTRSAAANLQIASAHTDVRAMRRTPSKRAAQPHTDAVPQAPAAR